MKTSCDTKKVLALAIGCAALAVAVGVFGPPVLFGQSEPPKYEIDPYWPKPLPENWVLGEAAGVCVDAHDHVFVLNRRNFASTGFDLKEGLTANELDAARPAPPVIEFDPEGNVVNSWGNPDVLPKQVHHCAFDSEGNIWITGSWDGMIQKWTHDGSKMLIQIGTRGVYDTSDGTVTGRALNSSHTAFFRPAGVWVDQGNGDVYIGDGYGNSRVAVFDRNGQFLRQWGRQGTRAEAEAGLGGAFMQVVHCVIIGNDGLVYVCDRQGDRVQVFDKWGNFQRNIWNRNGTPMPDAPSGTAQQVAFSPDSAQEFMYIGNEHNERVDILDHASGKAIGSFGRAGHQLGGFGHIHTLAMDSKGNLYVGEVNWGRRIQKFKIAAAR